MKKIDRICILTKYEDGTLHDAVELDLMLTKAGKFDATGMLFLQKAIENAYQLNGSVEIRGAQ